MKIQQREILFSSVAGLTAAMAVLAMPQLVAAPKLLFGRSLSAIAPSLFPSITLTLIVLFAASLISLCFISTRLSTDVKTIRHEDELDNNSGLLKTGLFFILLTAYGLLIKPVGFFISSFLVISAISLMLGNRNFLQILLLAIFAPACLYLIATRAMLVSLPELNYIELLYANAINWTTGRLTP